MLFLDVEGSEEQIQKADAELKKIGYLQNRDTDPKLCGEERTAILRRLGVGSWRIFVSHGSPKEYSVR